MRHSENHAKQAKHLPKFAQSDPRSGYVLPTSQDGASDAVLRVTRLLYHSASAQDGTEPLAGAAEADEVVFIVVATALCTPPTDEMHGTEMVAVMTTLPGATSIVTYSGSTPAALALTDDEATRSAVEQQLAVVRHAMIQQDDSDDDRIMDF